MLIITSILGFSLGGCFISKDSQVSEFIPTQSDYSDFDTITVISSTVEEGNIIFNRVESSLTPNNPLSTVRTVPVLGNDSARKHKSYPQESYKYGGTLKLISRQPFLHQDVHLEGSPSLSTWGPGIVYSRLLKFDSKHDLNTSISPVLVCDLCESWEMESDRTYIFKLRTDVLWHDMKPTYGRRLVPEDIQYSYNRQRQDGWPNSKMFSSISNIDIDENKFIRINLRFTDADLLNAIADPRSKIISPESVQLSGDLKHGPSVGTGPWIFNPIYTGGVYKFEKNINYFEN